MRRKIKKRVLDLGCGRGFRTKTLKRFEVFGIDVSRNNIEIAKSRYPNINFFVMQAEKLKFRSDYFNQIYAIDVLEHVSDLEKTLSEIKRVLKNNSELIVEIPYFRSESWLTTLRPNYPSEIGHKRIFKYLELEKVLKKNSFSLIKKKPKHFIQNLELYITLRLAKKSSSQLQIERSNVFLDIVHLFFLYFEPFWVFNSPLVLFPIWIVTLPIGVLINTVGNQFFPKTIYYEFKKK